jgi:hypothetical protein
MLEICIPTFNRNKEFEKCLVSIGNAFKHLNKVQSDLIKIRVHDNSTKNINEKIKIIKKFELEYNLRITYVRTGFNVGSSNNCSSVILSTESQYAWFVPDDDIITPKSLMDILNIIEQYKPDFICGGFVKKSIIDYAYDFKEGEFEYENTINDVCRGKEAMKKFMTKNTVQAQEYIYKMSKLNYYYDKDLISRCTDEMFPGIYAILCMSDNGVAIFMERSLGVFRRDDPHSDWRHRWFSLATHAWLENLRILYLEKIIDMEVFLAGKAVYAEEFRIVGHRPDILLGLNLKCKVNPIYLIKNYKIHYISSIFKMPVRIVNKIWKKYVS